MIVQQLTLSKEKHESIITLRHEGQKVWKISINVVELALWVLPLERKSGASKKICSLEAPVLQIYQLAASNQNP